MSCSSLITIVPPGAEQYLGIFLRAVARSRVAPAEVLVVYRGGPRAARLADPGVVVRQLDFGAVSPATARDRAAATAGEDILIFLDADCIPEPELVGVLSQQAALTRGLVVATPADPTPPSGCDPEAPLTRREGPPSHQERAFAIPKAVVERFGGVAAGRARAPRFQSGVCYRPAALSSR